MCAYHEYVDSQGNIHRQHYNGHRLGSIHPAVIVNRKPDDSYQWEATARKAFEELHALIGDLAWRAWWERNFEADGNTADNFTWKHLAEAAQLALDHPEALECACCLPEQSCPICRSLAHATSVAQEGA